MSQIVVRVSASADPSMGKAFAPLETAADRAAAKVAAASKRARKASSTEARAGATEQAKAAADGYRGLADAIRKSESESARHRAKEIRDAERNARIIQGIKNRTIEREMRERERAERQSASRSAQHSREARYSRWSMARDFGRGSVNNMGRAARAAIGGASDIARGMGMDPSLMGMTRNVVATEAAAIRATTAGKLGDNKVATSRDVEISMASIRSAADETRTSYVEMSAALEAFTSKSSDLELGQKVLKDIGNIAQMSGADLGELAAAAGMVSQSMGEYDDAAGGATKKAEDLMAVMRMIAKQGAMGSVEIKDLATYMPRLSATASKFAKDGDTGRSYKDNVGEMGAIAQMAIHGGRSTAAEATNAAAAFGRDLSKKSNLKYLADAGINVFADEGKTKLHSASDIIAAVYEKTKGDQSKISALFRNENSRAAVNAFADTYHTAGGGAEGIKAIKAKFAEFQKTFSADEVETAANLRKNSKAGKAQDLQNRFETAWGNALEKMVPALEKAAPALVQLAEAASKVLVWVADNPGRAIQVAIVGSIIKAGIGSAVSAALTKVVMGSGGGMPIPGLGGGPGGRGAPVPGGAAVPTVAAIAAISAVASEIAIAEDIIDQDKKGEATDALRNAERQGRTHATYEKNGSTYKVFRGGKGQIMEREIDTAEDSPFKGQVINNSDAIGVDNGRIGLELKKLFARRARDAEIEKQRLQSEAMQGTMMGGVVGGAAVGSPMLSAMLGGVQGGADGGMAMVKAAIDGTTAAIRAGITVNNLHEIKIPGAETKRTGPGD